MGYHLAHGLHTFADSDHLQQNPRHVATQQFQIRLVPHQVLCQQADSIPSYVDDRGLASSNFTHTLPDAALCLRLGINSLFFCKDHSQQSARLFLGKYQALVYRRSELCYRKCGKLLHLRRHAIFSAHFDHRYRPLHRISGRRSSQGPDLRKNSERSPA